MEGGTDLTKIANIDLETTFEDRRKRLQEKYPDDLKLNLKLTRF